MSTGKEATAPDVKVHAVASGPAGVVLVATSAGVVQLDMTEDGWSPPLPFHAVILAEEKKEDKSDTVDECHLGEVGLSGTAAASMRTQENSHDFYNFDGTVI